MTKVLASGKVKVSELLYSRKSRMSNNERKIGPHWRIPWRGDEPDEILVHCRFEELKGTFRKSISEQVRGTEKYLRAKRENNHDDAADLVDELLDNDIVEFLIDRVIESGMPVKVVFPHPEFESDFSPDPVGTISNAIPFALAAKLSVLTGGTIETDIIEIARPGRTKLNKFERFLWQPRFKGDVDLDAAYILVDDNCTLASTLAMLRTYIVGNGGTVIVVSALSSPQGNNCKFAIASEVVDVLISNYGREISPLWIQEIGHDITCLTNNEGSFLAEWQEQWSGSRSSLFQRLRARLDKAKATGKQPTRS